MPICPIQENKPRLALAAGVVLDYYKEQYVLFVFSRHNLPIERTPVMQWHWLALLIAVPVLRYQFKSWGRFSSYLRGQRSVFLELRQNNERPATDRGIAWLTWIRKCFPSQQDAATAGRWSRRDAFDQLDDALESNRVYQGLQRMSVVSPMTGVLITVTGFILLAFFSPPAQSGTSLAEILKAVLPLFMGVASGSVLAILNQWLLHRVAVDVEATRSAGRDWFDEIIWPLGGAQPLEEQAGREMRNLAASVEEALKKFSETAKTLSDAATTSKTALAELLKATNSASDSAKDGMQKFTDRIGDFDTRTGQLITQWQSLETIGQNLATQLGSVNQAFADHDATIKAVAKTADVLGTHGPIFETSFKGFEQTCTNFESVLTRLTQAVDDHEQQAAAYATQVATDLGGCSQAVDQIKDSTDKLKQFVSNSIADGEGNLDKLQQTVKSIQDADLLKPFDDLPQKIGASVDALNDMVTAQLKQVSAIQSDLEPVWQGLKDAAQVSQDITNLPDQIRKSLAELKDQLDEFSQSSFKRQVGDMRNLLHPLVTHLGDMRTTMEEIAKSNGKGG